MKPFLLFSGTRMARRFLPEGSGSRRCPGKPKQVSYRSTLWGRLGGSWVVISRVISRITIVISYTRGLITPLITTTTHDPPSRAPLRISLSVQGPLCCRNAYSRILIRTTSIVCGGLLSVWISVYTGFDYHRELNLVAEFISPKKYRLSVL